MARSSQFRFVLGRSTINVLVLLLLPGVYIGVRVYRLGFYSLWHDEVFSAQAAQQAWSNMFREIALDLVHPPLFYILLKLWIYIGGVSVWWMRLLPCLLAIATLPILFALFKELQLPYPGQVVALSFIALNSLLIRYSQELRMYSLLVLVSTASLLLFIRLIHGHSDHLLPLVAVNIALVYSHYYGCLFIVSEFVAMIVWIVASGERNWHGLRRFVAALLSTFLAFTPWIVVIATTYFHARVGLHSHLSWIVVPRLSSVGWFYETLNGLIPVRHTTTLGIVMFLVPVVAAFLVGQRRRELMVLAVFSFLPVAISFVLSQWLPLSVFDPRYLIGCAVPYLVMVAVATSSLKMRNIIATVLAIWAVWAGCDYIARSDLKIQWAQVASNTKVLRLPVYAAEDHEHLPLKYYGAPSVLLRSSSDLQEIDDRLFVLCYRQGTWNGDPPEQQMSVRGYSLKQCSRVADRDEVILTDVFEKH